MSCATTSRTWSGPGRVAPRHDPAVVLVPRRRGPALLPGLALGRRPVASEARGSCLLASVPPGRPRHRPPLDRQAADVFHLRGHPHPDRPRLRLSLPARPASGARPGDRTRRRSSSATRPPSPSTPPPGPGFDWAAVGVPADWPHHPSGFAAHWNKNSNLAWAFDVWFLNLFPRETPFALQRRRLRHPQLHPDARDDDPGPARGRRPAHAAARPRSA